MKKSQRQKTAEKKSAQKDPDKLLMFLSRWKELMLILLASTFIYTYTFDTKLDLNGDNVDYYLLGKALAEGKGYTTIWYPDSPPYTHRPPGYPLIIAAALTLGFQSFFAIKWLNFILFAGIIIFFYSICLKIVEDRTQSLVATALIAVNFHLIHFSWQMMSEISFLFFMILAFYFLIKTEESEKPFLKNPYLWLLVFSLSAAYHIKTVGVSMLLAVLVYLGFKKDWKKALAVLSGFVVIALPYYLRNKMLGSGSGYLKYIVYKNPYQRELGTMGLTDYIERIFSNGVRYLSIEVPHGILPFIDNSASGTLGWATGLILAVLSVFALIRLKRYRKLILSLFIVNAGILLIWPDVWVGIRFMIPLLPFLFLLLVISLRELFKPLKIKTNYMYLLVPLFLLANKDVISQYHQYAGHDYPPAYANYFNLASWAAANTNPKDIFIARKPQFFYLFSGRQTNTYLYISDDQALLKNMEAQRVKYVVIEQLGYGSTPRYLVPAIQKNQSRFRMVHQTAKPETYLLEFLSPDVGIEN
jgi:4-amino-4-deoxy-L-arabinose transferase-like glycosyltransferase